MQYMMTVQSVVDAHISFDNDKVDTSFLVIHMIVVDVKDTHIHVDSVVLSSAIRIRLSVQFRFFYYVLNEKVMFSAI